MPIIINNQVYKPKALQNFTNNYFKYTIEEKFKGKSWTELCLLVYFSQIQMLRQKIKTEAEDIVLLRRPFKGQQWS